MPFDIEDFEQVEGRVAAVQLELAPPDGSGIRPSEVAVVRRLRELSDKKAPEFILTNTRLVCVGEGKKPLLQVPLGAIVDVSAISKGIMGLKTSRFKIYVRFDSSYNLTPDVLKTESVWKLKVLSYNHSHLESFYRQIRRVWDAKEWIQLPELPHAVATSAEQANSLKQQEQERRDEYMSQLLGMGFSLDQAATIYEKGNGEGCSLNQLINWAVDHEDEVALAKERKIVGLGDIGLTGMVQEELREVNAGKRMIQEAFVDLDRLSKMASDLQALATEILERRKEKGDDEKEETTVDTFLFNELMSIGLIGDLSRERTGKRFVLELSRQVGEFLVDEVDSNQGVLSLTQAYRLFNRARFADPVLPDEFLAAIGQFENLDMPLELQIYYPDVKVLVSKGSKNEKLRSEIISFVLDQDTDTDKRTSVSCGVSSVKVSTALRIPIAVAKYYLSDAESTGILCRDEGPEGLVFHKNLFHTYQ